MAEMMKRSAVDEMLAVASRRRITACLSAEMRGMAEAWTAAQEVARNAQVRRREHADLPGWDRTRDEMFGAVLVAVKIEGRMIVTVGPERARRYCLDAARSRADFEVRWSTPEPSV